MVRIIIFATTILFLYATSYAQETNTNTPESGNMKNEKMKVEVWSDISCPFCYLGKHKFEKALAQFPDSAFIELEWKSFQLNPDLETNPDITIYEYLSAEKGLKSADVKQMTDYATQAAAQVGLVYNFDKVVVSNTFKAHRMLHFAKAQGLQSEAKERLFRANFTDGENIDDTPTLIRLGQEAGLDAIALKAILETGTNSAEVLADMHEAQQLGIHSVPYFIFNRKLAVSGAQDPAVFLQALEKAFAEWRKDNPVSAF
jgi:predicted DsbA family dithiol-disulfide isomerase